MKMKKEGEKEVEGVKNERGQYPNSKVVELNVGGDVVVGDGEGVVCSSCHLQQCCYCWIVLYCVYCVYCMYCIVLYCVYGMYCMVCIVLCIVYCVYCIVCIVELLHCCIVCIVCCLLCVVRIVYVNYSVYLFTNFALICLLIFFFFPAS